MFLSSTRDRSRRAAPFGSKKRSMASTAMEKHSASKLTPLIKLPTTSALRHPKVSRSVFGLDAIWEIYYEQRSQRPGRVVSAWQQRTGRIRTRMDTNPTTRENTSDNIWKESATRERDLATLPTTSSTTKKAPVRAIIMISLICRLSMLKVCKLTETVALRMVD